MLPKSGPILAAILLALPLSVSSSRADLAPLQLVTSQVISNPAAQTITFSLTFDRAPDLQSYNQYANAADEFAIDILNMPLDYPTLTGAGGEDIRLLSSQYRDPSSTANYGRVTTPLGYSAITTPRYQGSLLLNLIPYQQIGSTVTLTTPFSQLYETDGWFEATLETYRYGAWSGFTTEIGTAYADPLAGATASVPEPASLTLLGLGVMAMLARQKSGPRPFNGIH